jgi:hypothetical protein
MASRVLNRIALALPVLRIDKFGKAISTFSASSESGILRLANITSKLTTIGTRRGNLDGKFAFLLEFDTPLEYLRDNKNDTSIEEIGEIPLKVKGYPKP